MVHSSHALMPEIPLATSLPTTFTFQQQPSNQLDEQTALQQQHQQQQQQSVPSSSQSVSSDQPQRSSSNDDRNNANHHQSHPNDYESRLRCPNCDTWVVNLSDHLRKTHRIASPVDRKPLLRMARLEKRRMTESAQNPSTTNRQPSNLLEHGLPTSHAANNEIENLLFKHEQETNPQFSVSISENILLNHQMTNPVAHYSSPTSAKRPRSSTDHPGATLNGPLSPNKKSRISMLDETKISPTGHPAPGKTGKKNRNKQQQQTSQPQTIIKTAASGIFPQQTVAVQQQQQQHVEESSDDLSKVLQMMGNEMNFLNQHLQTTSILLQKQLDLARDSLHACSVQFAHLKRMIQQ